MVTVADYLADTRKSYDAVAAAYAGRFTDELAHQPVERAVLDLFAGLVRGTGIVVDAGCGTGRITGYLHDLGVDILGVDLSPGMLDEARRGHPGLHFVESSMLTLDFPDAAVAGVLAWYSTTHLPDDQLPAAFAEFFRVLAPGGYLLVGFQAGDHVLHLTEAFGQEVSLRYHRRRPSHVCQLLAEAGFALHTQVLREPMEGEGLEPTQKAYLLARTPPA